MSDNGRIVYLAGPMSGIKDYNFPTFNRIAGALRDRGVVVINPAETAGGVSYLPRSWYFKFDFAVIAACQAIYAMPGWVKSKGALAEVIYATEIGLPVYQLDHDGNVVGDPLTILEWRVGLGWDTFDRALQGSLAYGAKVDAPQVADVSGFEITHAYTHSTDQCRVEGE